MDAQRVQQVSVVDEALYRLAVGQQRERRGPDDNRLSRRHRQGSNPFVHRTRDILFALFGGSKAWKGFLGNDCSALHTKSEKTPVASTRAQPVATPMPAASR